jgi:hypothetical protein
MIQRKDKPQIGKEEALKLGQNRLKEIPKLTNVTDAALAVKPKKKKVADDFDLKRAIVLNFTRHSEPKKLMDLLSDTYEHIRLFRPIDDGLFVEGTIATTKINPLVSNPLKITDKTKSQQIEEWLNMYLTTKREDNNLFPLDPMGDYFVILPMKDAQVAIEILQALTAIKNVDWMLVWSIYNENTAEFEISEIVSTKGVYQSWKKKAGAVSDITNRRKQLLLTELSQAQDKTKYAKELSADDYKLIEYQIKKGQEKTQ